MLNIKTESKVALQNLRDPLTGVAASRNPP